MGFLVMQKQRQSRFSGPFEDANSLPKPLAKSYQAQRFTELPPLVVGETIADDAEGLHRRRGFRQWQEVGRQVRK